MALRLLPAWQARIVSGDSPPNWNLEGTVSNATFLSSVCCQMYAGVL